MYPLLVATKSQSIGRRTAAFAVRRLLLLPPARSLEHGLLTTRTQQETPLSCDWSSAHATRAHLNFL